jgi:WXG100 family type VII secretion target
MSDGIKMSFSEVENYSKKFQQEADNLDRSINNMYKYVNQLKQGWNGNAAQGFEEKLNSLKKNFNDTREVISSISSNLAQSAKEMREFDESMGNSWKS